MPMALRIVHTKTAVNKLEDLKGMKIRGTGTTAKIVAASGATPVAMPMGDTYDAISRGVAEGVVCPVEALQGWKLGEVDEIHDPGPTARPTIWSSLS